MDTRNESSRGYQLTAFIDKSQPPEKADPFEDGSIGIFDQIIMAEPSQIEAIPPYDPIEDDPLLSQLVRGPGNREIDQKLRSPTL
jgi:hypothetical protein